MNAATASASTPPDRLTAYIRSNVTFINQNQAAASAVGDILTGYRSPEALCRDGVRASPPPQAGLASLDPESIFDDGVASGQFRSLSPRLMKTALRATLAGAVWESSRDPEYDVIGYGEELVTVFERATQGPRQMASDRQSEHVVTPRR